ncbi:MAG: thermonuclease family protein [Clostridia bacterium]
MYYNNKSTFYVKQYGPAVIISIISILLISTGAFIYFKTSGMENPFKNKTEIADKNNSNVIDNKVEEKIVVDTIPNKDEVVEKNAIVENNTEKEQVNTKYFDNLPSLEKSKEVKVTNISETGNITVEVNDAKIELNLIGVDYKYSNLNVIVEKMKTDLLNKNVKIAFDTVKVNNGITCGYVYNNKSLYNSELLKTGLVSLKTERQNTHLNKDLAKAQAYARENVLGIWKK